MKRALKTADQAVEEATKREHPVAVCMSLVYTVPVYLWSGVLNARLNGSNVFLRIQRNIPWPPIMPWDLL